MSGRGDTPILPWRFKVSDACLHSSAARCTPSQSRGRRQCKEVFLLHWQNEIRTLLFDDYQRILLILTPRSCIYESSCRSQQAKTAPGRSQGDGSVTPGEQKLPWKRCWRIRRCRDSDQKRIKCFRRGKSAKDSALQPGTWSTSTQPHLLVSLCSFALSQALGVREHRLNLKFSSAIANSWISDDPGRKSPRFCAIQSSVLFDGRRRRR